MRIKKYAAAFLAATTVIGSLAACNKKQPTSGDATPAPTGGSDNPDATKTPEGPTNTPTPAATPIPDRDLGGIEIIIGDHWSPETPAEPANKQEEDTAKYRAEIQEKYHFTIQSKTVAGYQEMTDTCVNSITAGDPAAQIFNLDYRFVAKPMANGLFYDLATLSNDLDFSEDKWNVNVKWIMTKGSSIYGMRAEASEPRGGVIWNKRLFEEAGLDPNLPYQLQRDGQWTWSKFDELCSKLTRDTNQDGVTDIYATCSQGAQTLMNLVASCGQDWFTVDADGKISNNCKNPDVLKAMNFAVDLYNKGYEKPQPADAAWDWFYPAFQAAEAAMIFDEEYRCGPTNTFGDAMADDVGFVMPPKPDGQEEYLSYVCDNICIIPSCYDAETASKIAFGYNVYTMHTPGYDDPLDWLDAYYSHFNDEWAVDETIIRFNDPSIVKFKVETLIPDLNIGDLVWQYPFQNFTPADRVDEIWEAWQAILDECNSR